MALDTLEGKGHTKRREDALISIIVLVKPVNQSFMISQSSHLFFVILVSPSSSRTSLSLVLPLLRIKIRLRLRFLVLLNQIRHHLSSLVELSEPIGKHGRLFVALQEGVPPSDLVVLYHYALEECGDGCVVGEHQARDPVRVW